MVDLHPSLPYLARQPFASATTETRPGRWTTIIHDGRAWQQTWIDGMAWQRVGRCDATHHQHQDPHHPARKKKATQQKTVWSKRKTLNLPERGWGVHPHPSIHHHTRPDHPNKPNGARNDAGEREQWPKCKPVVSERRQSPRSVQVSRGMQESKRQTARQAPCQSAVHALSACVCSPRAAARATRTNDCD